jgi:hypothetical protein
MPVFTIEMLPARQGDALFVEWGDDPDSTHRLLIDAGTPGTFKAVSERIAKLDPGKRNFELLVVSHIDSDHIGGTIPLLKDKDLGATYEDVWFNGLKHLPKSDVEPFGPTQGDELTKLLKQRTWNGAWQGEAVVVPEEGPPPVKPLADGMTLTLLSPFAQQLRNLRPEWPETVLEHGLVEGVPPTAPPELGPAGDIDVFGAAVPATPDDVTDIADLADRAVIEDTAAPNGTSIALLLEFGKRSVLLNADAHPSVLRRGIEALLKHRKKPKLVVDAFKLPHHGSRFNIDLPLLEKVECRRHLISTDGTQTEHPHIEGVARVLATSDQPELVFNYRSKWNAVWDDDEVVKRGKYSRRFPPEHGGPGIVFDVMQLPAEG